MQMLKPFRQLRRQWCNCFGTGQRQPAAKFSFTGERLRVAGTNRGHGDEDA